MWHIYTQSFQILVFKCEDMNIISELSKAMCSNLPWPPEETKDKKVPQLEEAKRQHSIQ